MMQTTLLAGCYFQGARDTLSVVKHEVGFDKPAIILQ